VFKFITKRPLWANLLFGIGIAIILVVLFLQSLDWLTRHGKTLSIPAVTGKTYADAQKILEEKGFDVEIQDSVYNDTAAPLTVLRQFPDADALVKVNRTVYLTINRAVPPVIEMPNMEGLSFRSAQIALQQYGLKLEDTVYRTDFAKNSVLEQQYNGQRIKAGTKIAQGSKITLVLGSGLGNEEFGVPDLFGQTLGDARVLLESNGLNLGSVLPAELQSNTSAFIVRQSPDHLTPDGRPNRIRQGQFIDIWLQLEKPPDRQVDTTGNNPN
jgi:eukaryotic-like serine/threonine-protein kinase